MLDSDQVAMQGVLRALPIFPLPNVVLLPGSVLPLNVFEPRYVDLVNHVLKNGQYIGVPLLRPGFQADYEGSPKVESVFGVGRLISHQRLADGRWFIRLEGQARVRMVREIECTSRFRQVEAELLPEESPNDDVQLDVLRAQLERIASTLPDEDRQLVCGVSRIRDSRVFVYAVAAIVPTLGIMPDVLLDGRSPLLDVQQRCIAARNADARVMGLLECAGSMCTLLSDTGRFPRDVLN